MYPYRTYKQPSGFRHDHDHSFNMPAHYHVTIIIQVSSGKLIPVSCLSEQSQDSITFHMHRHDRYIASRSTWRNISLVFEPHVNLEDHRYHISISRNAIPSTTNPLICIPIHYHIQISLQTV